MSIINYKDPFFIQWNLDEYGNKVSVEILNEQRQVIGNILVLSQLPDIQYRVFIDETFVEIDIKDEITQTNQFKVDYTYGYIVTHPSLSGQTLNIKRYYGRGVILTHVSRIFTKVEGDVAETLASIIEDGTDALTAYGGIVKAINDAEIKKQALDGSITTGTSLNSELDGNILTGSQLKTDLDNDISQGIIVKNELEQAITNGDLDTIRNNITDLAGEGRTTETVKDNSDKIGILNTKVSPETQLNTTSQNLSGAVNEVKSSFDAHKAEKATRNDLGHIRLEEFFMVGTLQNGWTGNLQYAKNDLGLVTVKADVTVGTVAADAIICTLPEGYRTNRRTPIPVQIVNTSSGSLGLYLNDTGGHIRVSGGSGLSQGQNIRFMIIYNIN